MERKKTIPYLLSPYRGWRRNNTRRQDTTVLVLTCQHTQLHNYQYRDTKFSLSIPNLQVYACTIIAKCNTCKWRVYSQWNRRTAPGLFTDHSPVSVVSRLAYLTLLPFECGVKGAVHVSDQSRDTKSIPPVTLFCLPHSAVQYLRLPPLPTHDLLTLLSSSAFLNPYRYN